MTLAEDFFDKVICLLNLPVVPLTVQLNDGKHLVVVFALREIVKTPALVERLSSNCSIIVSFRKFVIVILG